MPVGAPLGNQNNKKFPTPESRKNACDLICAHLAQGKSRASLKVCDWDTVETYCDRYPIEFPRLKILEAERAGMDLWESRMRDGALGEIPGFNASAAQFLMRGMYRKQWADPKQLDINSNLRVETRHTIDTINLQPEERDALRLALQKVLSPPDEIIDGEYDDVE